MRILALALAGALAVGVASASDDARAAGLLDDAQSVIGGSKGKPAAPSDSGSLGDSIQDVIEGSGSSSPVKSGSTGSPASLTDAEVDLGLRDALRIGTDRVVGSLGTVDGFNLSDVHIPLPATLSKVQNVLQKVGQSELVDDLELRLNRAAETATPLAKDLFWQAIDEMTLDDARGILTGPDDSATQYFRSKMSNPLAVGMRPIVDDALADAGAVQAYDRMIGAYEQVPLVPDAKADLTTYVLEKAIDGIFVYLGREEAAIRQNPAERTTDILKKVFGAV